MRIMSMSPAEPETLSTKAHMAMETSRLSSATNARAAASVAVNGNGNGHHEDVFGPTVELVPANGHANGNGNGHHEDEAPEPQQSLFSWAEFMAEEPVKPKGRKTQAPSLSLFEWAVEQEREEEPVGAGR